MSGHGEAAPVAPEGARDGLPPPGVGHGDVGRGKVHSECFNLDHRNSTQTLDSEKAEAARWERRVSVICGEIERDSGGGSLFFENFVDLVVASDPFPWTSGRKKNAGNFDFWEVGYWDADSCG